MAPDGCILMRLGVAGASSGGPNSTSFTIRADVVIAPNGDIFVADGHGTVAPDLPPDTITCIIKFTPDGKHQGLGSLGSGKSCSAQSPCAGSICEGRLFVADRINGRIQIFDQDGKWLTEYHAFNHPSGLYIDKTGHAFHAS